MEKKSQEMRFNGKPEVWSLAVDAPSQSQEFLGELFLRMIVSDVLNDGIGKRQVEAVGGKRRFAGIASDV